MNDDAVVEILDVTDPANPALVGSVATPGTAYVFRRIGTTWVQEAQLFSGFPQSDRFGPALHLQGELLAVGAANENEVWNNDGATYVFRRSGTMKSSLVGGRP